VNYLREQIEKLKNEIEDLKNEKKIEVPLKWVLLLFLIILTPWIILLNNLINFIIYTLYYIFFYLKNKEMIMKQINY